MSYRLTIKTLGCAIVLNLIGASTMANAIEEPQYELLQQFDAVEIRRYEPVIQAVTVLPGSTSTSAGFRRLAGFIFGGNEQEASISMTAPVSETLGTDQPVMAFTMPSQYSMEELPLPLDDRVRLLEVDARLVAVTAFSGWATEARVARYEQELRQSLVRQGLQTRGHAILNQYNPPWTLPFMRRNEVMLEVVAAPHSGGHKPNTRQSPDIQQET